MKRSIKRLPKRTQEELEVLVELITKMVTNCHMIILYGSYARGEHVFWDERFDFGTHTVFQSDLDILIVLHRSSTNLAEHTLRGGVTDKYHKIFEKLRPSRPGSIVRRHASPQFIVEKIGRLNKVLERSQYFFTDIVKDGIMIYDSKEFKLAKPRDLSFREIKEIAVEEFGIKINFANEFLKIGYFNFREEMYITGSFQLHQACERYYNAISVVFYNYKEKTHELKELLGRVKKYSRELVTVFPCNTDFEIHCYDLLCRAYIEARYNSKFVVTKEEYEYMLARTELLKEITERICTEKIQSYDALIEVPE